MAKYVCGICGYIYDEATGLPDAGIAPGTGFGALPEDWVCPICKAPKSAFIRQDGGETPKSAFVSQSGAEASKQGAAGTTEAQDASGENPEKKAEARKAEVDGEALQEMSFAQISALCSNLAKGCEKQYLAREAELFTVLAGYYKEKAGVDADGNFDVLLERINDDLAGSFPSAKEASEAKPDRGALRALVWSEKVTMMLNSLIGRYQREKEQMLLHTNIYVCEICGFVYVGDEPPEICPVCKVPSKKLKKVERS